MSDNRSVRATVHTAWTDVLGVPPEYEGNFFEAGGDSLLAVELLTTLSDELGHAVPVAELYRSPAFDDLVALVTTAGGSDDGDGDGDGDGDEAGLPTAHHVTGRAVVRLRAAGAGRLWCFLPPLSGAVTRYAAMPRLLPPGDAVWAVETPAELSSQGMAVLVSGLADRLAAADLAQFDTIVFAGYSLGGVFAHELAREVARRASDPARPVVLACLLDPPDPEGWTVTLETAFDIFVRVGWRIEEPVDGFVRGAEDFDLAAVAAAARRAGTLAPAADDQEIVDAWTVYASNARILDGFEPTPGVAGTHLLQCRDDLGFDAGTYGPAPAQGRWAAAVPAANASILAVDHFAMMEAPNDGTVVDWMVGAVEAGNLPGVAVPAGAEIDAAR